MKLTTGLAGLFCIIVLLISSEEPLVYHFKISAHVLMYPIGLQFFVSHKIQVSKQYIYTKLWRSIVTIIKRNVKQIAHQNNTYCEAFALQYYLTTFYCRNVLKYEHLTLKISRNSGWVSHDVMVGLSPFSWIINIRDLPSISEYENWHQLRTKK